MWWNHKKDLSLLFLIAVIALICLIQAWKISNRLSNVYQCVGVRILEEGGITKEKVLQIWEEEQKKEESNLCNLAAYSLKREVIVLEENWNRTQKVSCVIVYGDMNLVLTSPLTSGSAPIMGERNGCIIDEKTAYSLFGTTHVIGQVLLIENRHYYIRGLIKSENPILFLPCIQEQSSYANLELQYNKIIDDQRTETEQFIYTYGISNHYVIIEENFVQNNIQTIVKIPILLIVFSALIYFIKKLKQNKGYFVGIFAILGGGFFIVTRLYIPVRYLPSKWSDFSHWGKIGKEIQTNISQMNYLSPVPKDILLKESCFFAVLLIAIVIILFFIFIDIFNHLLYSKTRIITKNEEEMPEEN